MPIHSPSLAVHDVGGKRKAIGANVPLWPAFACVALGVLGTADSVYLTIVHYTSVVHLYCPTSGGIVNCDAVTTSPQSVLLGIPVPVMGIVWFIAMIALCWPADWLSTNKVLIAIRFVSALAGVGFALYLVAVELLVIDKICLWCTGAHVGAFALFIIVVASTPSQLFQSHPPLPSGT